MAEYNWLLKICPIETFFWTYGTLWLDKKFYQSTIYTDHNLHKKMVYCISNITCSCGAREFTSLCWIYQLNLYIQHRSLLFGGQHGKVMHFSDRDQMFHSNDTFTFKFVVLNLVDDVRKKPFVFGESKPLLVAISIALILDWKLTSKNGKTNSRRKPWALSYSNGFGRHDSVWSSSRSVEGWADLIMVSWNIKRRKQLQMSIEPLILNFGDEMKMQKAKS